MNKQLDEIIDLLRGITTQLSSIEEGLKQVNLNTQLAEKPENPRKMDESYGFIRGADYYANLANKKQQ